MTESNRPTHDDALPPAPEASPAKYTRGDVLHPEWGERPPWFGYIGVGIAIAAMLLGIVLMIVFVTYGIRWIGS